MSTPRSDIARGDAWACLAALADLALARAEHDPRPQRRARLRRMAEYITRRLARRILRDLQ